MAINTLELGDLAACCYIITPAAMPADGQPTHAVVVDPGAEAARVTSALKRINAKLEAILLTHSHVDHIGGVDDLLADWPGSVLMASAETSRRASDSELNLSAYMGPGFAIAPAGRELEDGETFAAAGMQWKAVIVPGHDPGEMVFILGDAEAVFAGDTVFQGSIGRSDFPGGDGRALVESILDLFHNSLKPQTVIYPGHGSATTVAEELAHNPFLSGRMGGW